jgi:hypothetical protein
MTRKQGVIATEAPVIRNYIDGEWVDSKSGEIIDVENPATGEVIARVPMSVRAEVEQANRLLHPAAFFMSHDELRVINQCALCQSKHMTPGELLAWNVHQAAQIIRDIRPDAEIWVWSDMFDPMHNAVDHYYAVNGSLRGSWEGLDPDVGIVNWDAAAEGRNARFFAERGEPFDAVILDLPVAAGLGGEACLRELQALDPDAEMGGALRQVVRRRPAQCQLQLPRPASRHLARQPSCPNLGR